MKQVTVYDLNRYFDLCGSLFLLRYTDHKNTAKIEPCRIFVGCKGAAVYDLPADQMAFCYIGDFCSDRPLVQPVEWSCGSDGVKECDALSFLHAHHIPYNINCFYARIRKAEKYIGIWKNAYLGDKGLVKIVQWSDSVHAYYYFSPGHVLDPSDPSVSIRYIGIIETYNKSAAVDLHLSAFARIEQGDPVSFETFKQWIHVDRVFEKIYISIFPATDMTAMYVYKTPGPGTMLSFSGTSSAIRNENAKFRYTSPSREQALRRYHAAS